MLGSCPSWSGKAGAGIHHDGESHQIAFMLVPFTLVAPDLNSSPVCSHLGIQSSQILVFHDQSLCIKRASSEQDGKLSLEIN